MSTPPPLAKAMPTSPLSANSFVFSHLLKLDAQNDRYHATLPLDFNVQPLSFNSDGATLHRYVMMPYCDLHAYVYSRSSPSGASQPPELLCHRSELGINL
jgi:hypothetical protein